MAAHQLPLISGSSAGIVVAGWNEGWIILIFSCGSDSLLTDRKRLHIVLGCKCLRDEPTANKGKRRFLGARYF
jgi:hypothetical protein